MTGQELFEQIECDLYHVAVEYDRGNISGETYSNIVKSYAEGQMTTNGYRFNEKIKEGILAGRIPY